MPFCRLSEKGDKSARLHDNDEKYAFFKDFFGQTYLSDKTGSDGRSRIAQHKPTQIFELAKEFDTNWSLQFQLDETARVLRQAPAKSRYEFRCDVMGVLENPVT